MQHVLKFHGSSSFLFTRVGKTDSENVFNFQWVSRFNGSCPVSLSLSMSCVPATLPCPLSLPPSLSLSCVLCPCPLSLCYSLPLFFAPDPCLRPCPCHRSLSLSLSLSLSPPYHTKLTHQGSVPVWCWSSLTSTSKEGISNSMQCYCFKYRLDRSSFPSGKDSL